MSPNLLGCVAAAPQGTRTDSTALVPNLTQGFVTHVRGKWLASPQNPNTLLLSQRRSSSHRPENDLVHRTLQFQPVTRAQLQFVPHRLGQNYPSRLVNRQSGCHVNIFTMRFAIKNDINNGPTLKLSSEKGLPSVPPVPP